jgi:chromo domain-containing protein 1
MAWEYDPQKSFKLIPPRYDCVRIFPHGGFIYITDEVFEQKPVEALKIIKLFVAKVDKCRSVRGPIDFHTSIDDGHLFWRLVTRPELMQTTWDWLMAHEAEVTAGEEFARRLASHISLPMNIH